MGYNYGGPRYHTCNFFDNIGANCTFWCFLGETHFRVFGKCLKIQVEIHTVQCSLVTSSHQKWDGKFTLFHPILKSAITNPAVCI